MRTSSGTGPAGPGELVTGEAVALDLRTAALPSRFVASALDGAAQLALFTLLALLAAVSAAGLSEAAGDALAVVTIVLVLTVYPVAFETVLRGRTPGKAAMGLRVVRDDGGPIGFRHALVRGLSAAVLERPGPTLFVLPVVTMLLNRRNKRLGDLLAGTVVVQERVPRTPADLAQMPPPLEGWARTLELSRLSDDLALSVRSFVARAPELDEAAREDLGGRLVAAVREVTAPPPPLGTPGWAFLAAVLAERRRRETERLSAQTAPPVGPRPWPASPAAPQSWLASPAAPSAWSVPPPSSAAPDPPPVSAPSPPAGDEPRSGGFALPS